MAESTLLNEELSGDLKFRFWMASSGLTKVLPVKRRFSLSQLSWKEMAPIESACIWSRSSDFPRHWSLPDQLTRSNEMSI